MIHSLFVVVAARLSLVSGRTFQKYLFLGPLEALPVKSLPDRPPAVIYTGSRLFTVALSIFTFSIHVLVGLL